MGLAEDFIKTVAKLSALEQRTGDVAANLVRVSERLDNLLDRLSKIEANLDNLKENVRTEILGEVRADFARITTLIEYGQDVKIVDSKKLKLEKPDKKNPRKV